jgi:hypothetical protein
VLAVGVLLLVVPAAALAARPVPGGRYLLMQTFQPANDGIPVHMGVLQVAPNGRALTSEGVPYSPVSDDYFGSYFEDQLHVCGLTSDPYFRFGAPENRPVGIDRSGRFEARATGDDDRINLATITLRGRFVSRTRAVLSIVAGTYRADRQSPVCAIPRQTVHFRLRPMPPFGSCARAHGKTVLSTATSRVYKTWGVDEVGGDRYAYACRFGGHAIALGASAGDPDGTTQHFQLAGPYVSFVSYINNESGLVEHVGVVDLRGFGRTVRSAAPSTTTGDYGFAAKPLLSARGSSAWVAFDCGHRNRACGRPYEVWVADRAGTRRVDRGDHVNPKSLTLHGTTLSWRNGGETKTATLE